MMDLGTGIAAANAALSTVKGLMSLDKALSLAELKMQVSQLYSDLADVRMALTDARDELAKAKAWGLESGHYRLVTIGGSSFAYALVSGFSSEPPHWLCQPCFQKGVKSILQSKGNEEPSGRRSSYAKWDCPTCKSSIRAGYMTKPAYADEGDVDAPA